MMILTRPQALAAFFELAREANGAMSQGALSFGTLKEINKLFSELGGTLLGIIPDALHSQRGATRDLESELIEFILELRADVRTEKLWLLSDKIRDGLARLGVLVEDKKGETSWRRAQATD